MPYYQANTTVAAIYPTATAQSHPIASACRAMHPTRQLLLVPDEWSFCSHYLEMWDWLNVEMCSGRSSMMPWRSTAERFLEVLEMESMMLGPHRRILQMLPMCLWISRLGYWKRMLWFRHLLQLDLAIFVAPADGSFPDCLAPSLDWQCIPCPILYSQRRVGFAFVGLQMISWRRSRDPMIVRCLCCCLRGGTSLSLCGKEA